MNRSSLLAVAALAAVVVLPSRGRAQIAAPAMVEEDLPTEEPPPRPAGEPTPMLPILPPREDAGTPAKKSKVQEGEPVRALEGVHHRYADLEDAWRERRDALREQIPSKAKEAEQRVLDLRRELAIENLDDLAAAEARAAFLAVDAHIVADALSRAELAVALAPDLPEAHLALARARWARDSWTQPGPALREVSEAVKAAWRAPQSQRAILGDAYVSVLMASFLASAAALSLLLLRRLRLLLHDANHLPLLRFATPFQAGLIALAVLSLPIALRLGPALTLAVFALALAPYLTLSERVIASLALAIVAALPWATQRAAENIAWTGTLAEEVYRLEQGSDDGRGAAKLEVRAARGELPAPALLALGRSHKRRGDLASALHWYEAAGTSRPDVLVNMGNVHFLQGDLEGAKAAYLSAMDRANSTGDLVALAAAHYDLAKLFLRSSALDQAQEARKKAALAAPEFIEHYGSDEDFRANRWLVDVPLSAAEIAGLAADDAPRAVADAVQTRLAGALPVGSVPGLLFGAAVFLWLMGFLRHRLEPSTVCERCGGPNCTRCGPSAGSLCGQCVNVFVKKGVVEPRDRLRKQAAVSRHARWRKYFARGLAIVTGGGGHVWNGAPVRGALALLGLAFLAILAVLGQGAIPSAHPSAWGTTAKLAVDLPLALALWWGCVRDLFRRTRD